MYVLISLKIIKQPAEKCIISLQKLFSKKLHSIIKNFLFVHKFEKLNTPKQFLKNVPISVSHHHHHYSSCFLRFTGDSKFLLKLKTLSFGSVFKICFSEGKNRAAAIIGSSSVLLLSPCSVQLPFSP